MKNSLFKRGISLVLTVMLILSMGAFPAFASSNTAADALSSAIGYYETQRGKTLATFWESLAVFGSGQNVSNGWTLPDLEVDETSLTTDIAGAAINELMKGDYPSGLIERLQQKQNINTGSLDTTINGHMWAMIALDTAGAQYDRNGAASYLVGLQRTNGSFSLTGSQTEDNTDVTSMAAIALAPYKGTVATSAIEGVKTYLKTKIGPNGGFTSAWGINANCTAITISALVAIGEDPLEQQWSKNGKTPLDQLLSYQTPSGGFGYSSNQNVNKMATEQATMALGDLVSGKSVFRRIAEANNKITASVRVVTPGGVVLDQRNLEVTNFDLTNYGVTDTAAPVALHALLAALEASGMPGAVEVAAGGVVSVNNIRASANGYWMFYVNDHMPVDAQHASAYYTICDYPIANNDVLTVFLTPDWMTGVYSYFDQTSVAVQAGESFGLTLSGSSISADMFGIGTVAPVANAEILVDGQPYVLDGQAVRTDGEGKVNLSFASAGEYAVSARILLGGVEGSYDLSLASCLVNVSPLPSPSVVTKNIQVRIEGIDHTISAMKNFSATGLESVNALDAAIQYFQATTMEYTIGAGGGYISGVDGIVSGHFGAWDGWMYFVNDIAPEVGMGDYHLSDGDELVIYYGNYGVTNIPNIELAPEKVKKGDDITLHLSSSRTLYDASYMPIGTEEFDLSDIDVSFAGISYKTGADGRLIIPTADIAAGSYVLSVSKNVDNSYPALVRKEIPVDIYNVKTAHVRVEGIAGTLTEDKSFQVWSTGAVNAMDAIKQLLQRENISYTLGAGDSYIESIGDLSAGHFGGWDGWLYILNNAMPYDAMGSTLINDGDELVIYYGDMDTYIPTISYTYNEETHVMGFKVTETHMVYDSAWQPVGEVTNNIAGVKIALGDFEAQTNDSGEADFQIYRQPGEIVASVSKSKENGCPYIITSYVKILIEQALDSTADIPVDTVRPIFVDTPTTATSAALVPTAQTVGASKTAQLPLIQVKGSVAELEIEGGTIVTSAAGWDGRISLPKTVTKSLSGKTISQVVEIGSDMQNLTLSKPARIVIKDAASKQIGIIDKLGSLNEISYVMASDAASALPDTQLHGKISIGNDVVVWTKHFSTFIAYTVNGGGGSSDPDAVLLYVKGDASKGVILSNTSVTLQSSDTPISILVRQLGSKVEVKNGYVRSIDGLAEFDKGAESGWMYSVNGVFPQGSAADVELKDDDKVKWLYTLDGGVDIGATDADTKTPSGSSGGSITVVAPKTDYDFATPLSEVLKALQGKAEPEEFDIFALAVNGISDPKYPAVLEQVAAESGGEFRKSTDLSKLILAAEAVGLDATKVGGLDLVDRLKNYENITKQGTNAPIFALIAFDGLGSFFTDNGLNTRDTLLAYILDAQNADGGFALAQGSGSDIDITSMALAALSKYTQDSKVKAAVDKALAYLSAKQLSNGGFSGQNGETSESISQVMIALSSLGIQISDTRFVKTGGDLYSELMKYKTSAGAYAHVKSGEVNDMATNQTALALTACKRMKDGLPSLYDIGKKELFKDLGGVDWAKQAIETLAGKGIIAGTGGGYFNPDASLTREQLVKLLVLAFEIPTAGADCDFADVAKDQWYFPYIAAAKTGGIVSGVSDTEFGVEQPITRQDLAVMIYRVLQMKNKAAASETDITQVFTDGSDVADYAVAGVLALAESNIVKGTGDNQFLPQKQCTRAEAAVIVYRLMEFLSGTAQ